MVSLRVALSTLLILSPIGLASGGEQEPEETSGAAFTGKPTGWYLSEDGSHVFRVSEADVGVRRQPSMPQAPSSIPSDDWERQQRIEQERERMLQEQRRRLEEKKRQMEEEKQKMMRERPHQEEMMDKSYEFQKNQVFRLPDPTVGIRKEPLVESPENPSGQ